jgi:subtilisin family serine protease
MGSAAGFFPTSVRRTPSGVLPGRHLLLAATVVAVSLVGCLKGGADAGALQADEFSSQQQRSARSGDQQARRASNALPAGETRFVSNEVIIEVDGAPTQDAVEALARRHRLRRAESQTFRLTKSTIFRWEIPDGRSMQEVIRQLSADPAIRTVQPNYVYSLQQQSAAEGDPAQYTLAKLNLRQAHAVSRGDNVLVAVIDSGIDVTHPDLSGVIAGTFATFDPGEKPHTHGTAIAGAIASQARLRLMGIAPAARILAVKAFGTSDEGAEGTTMNIIKGLEWSIQQGARIINMSFAGPDAPVMRKILAGARNQGIVLIAAAGNAGPKSPPLYPGSDPNVIAVSATDSEDKLFAASNRGSYISVAAPGVDILLPAPDQGYQVTSGTSFAAAHVTGIVALMLQRNPDLTPAAVRKVLESTARDIGPKGRDDQFGAGLADAFKAIMAVPAIAKRDPKASSTAATQSGQ